MASGLQERLFTFIHGNRLIYNACWEDPRLDRELLGLEPESTVVAITSAGCNVLDYLLDGPGVIHVVDVTVDGSQPCPSRGPSAAPSARPVFPPGRVSASGLRRIVVIFPLCGHQPGLTRGKNPAAPIVALPFPRLWPPGMRLLFSAYQ